MGIIGFNFTKIDANKNVEANTAQKGMEVNHSISITNVSKIPLNMSTGNKNDALRIEFDFKIKYQEVGTINLNGDALYTDTPEIVEESMISYQENKKLPEMVDLAVRKFIYNKSLMQAMSLSDLLNLPAPIPLPRFEKKNKE